MALVLPRSQGSAWVDGRAQEGTREREIFNQELGGFSTGPKHRSSLCTLSQPLRAFALHVHITLLWLHTPLNSLLHGSYYTTEHITVLSRSHCAPGSARTSYMVNELP